MTHDVPTAARRHPSATFGVAGGVFALGFLLAASADRVTAGEYVPSGPEAVLVVGGVAGGALLARLLWGRLDAARSPLRGAAVGALVGLLALPVPFFLLELGLIAVDGVPFDPRPGAPPLPEALRYAFLLLATPLLLGAVGLIPTYAGTVVVGALTGYLLARRRA